MKSHSLVACGVLVATASTASFGATVFFDNFQADVVGNEPLKWNDVNASGRVGVVPDTLSKALTFLTPGSGGDTYTNSGLIPLVANQKYTLSFSYYGQSDTVTADNTPRNDGNGFIGLSLGTPGNHYWLAGTHPDFLGQQGGAFLTNVSVAELQDTNSSANYTVSFTSLSNQNVRIISEDFSSSGVGGAAYFDNVNIAVVPLPPAMLGGMALMGVVGGYGKIRRWRGASHS
jgi:hypothetical protein